MQQLKRSRRHAALMIQGTGSDVGKSLIVTGLCRLFARFGWVVYPFKPQNMSNNAAVTCEGGEIGRAQALQAQAAGLSPTVDMNPVLLKPEAENGSQLVLHGRAIGRVNAVDFRDQRGYLLNEVLASFQRLREQADLVLVEGAGSPAEVNLRDHDIANMGFAMATDVNVILVTDIARGGSIASLVGTHALLAPEEQARLGGFIVNRFRGEASLFNGGRQAIVTRTGLRDCGLLPELSAARTLPVEDSASLRIPLSRSCNGDLRIVVPRLPRIANSEDLDPLALTPDVQLIFAEQGRPLPEGDIIILPGSKATRADLTVLCSEGWDIDILAHHRRGGVIFGLCGGFQMLGRCIEDPQGIEGEAGVSQGLGLLNMVTRMRPEKHVAQVKGHDYIHGAQFKGYEIHCGCDEGHERPWLALDPDGRPEGAISACGRVFGTHVHGLFASDHFRRAVLESLSPRIQHHDNSFMYEHAVEAALDDLARACEKHLDIPALGKLAGISSLCPE